MSAQARRTQYSQVEASLDRVGAPDWQRDDLEAWASGETAMEYFGRDTDAVDTLFLLAYHARQMNYVLYSQIEACLMNGHSWNEVAAGLGISRQAAMKRFDRRNLREPLTPLRAKNSHSKE